MAGWAVPEEETSGEKQQQQLLQPWILKMNQVAGVGGVSILGGIFIAAAFAGSRFLARRSSAPCQGPHEEGKIRAGDKEDHKLEIMQKEIYDLVQEMKHVERTPLLEDSELDNVEKEEEDEQKRGVLDKTKFPCTNINGEYINLSSSYVAEEGMEVFTNVSEVEEEVEEDYSSEEEEEEEEEDDYDDADEEDEVMEMGELGAEVTPVSSSSSLGSNSEAIWPAEKLEQEKTLPSVLILNNTKIERVKKDVMHIEEEEEEEEEEEGSESKQMREQSFCEEDSSSEKVKTRARSRRRMTESRDKNEFMKAFSGLLLLLLMAVMLICLGLLLISSMENANYHLRRHFQKHPWHFLHAIFAAA